MRRFITVYFSAGRLGLAFLFLLTASFAAVAVETKTSPVCVKTEARCEADCEHRFNEGDAAKMGCLARCAADRAACEAGAQFDAAKPWIDRRMEEMKRFYDGFKGDEKSAPPPQSPPAPKPMAPKQKPEDGRPDDLGPKPKSI